jgi:GR25 family glycosyltransferase involved in LPS biosynthesis
MKGFNNFDVLYYINIAHRTDRKEHLLEELSKTDIDHNKINRIDAIYLPEFGVLGCIKSHINALDQFLQTSDDIQNCLIIEDDFKFKDHIKHTDEKTYLDDFFQQKIDYDVLVISGNLLSHQHTDIPYLVKVQDVQCTSGYCVTKRYATKLLENFKECAALLENAGNRVHDLCIDIYWKRLQKTDNWFAMNPMIAEQMMSYSDIDQKAVYYGC